MERARELGYARSIGISNFSARELEEVIAAATIPPAVRPPPDCPPTERSGSSVRSVGAARKHANRGVHPPPGGPVQRRVWVSLAPRRSNGPQGDTPVFMLDRRDHRS
jgi:hypothetical protein